MKAIQFVISLSLLLSCSSKPLQQREETSEREELFSKIEAGSFSSFQQIVYEKGLENLSGIHSYFTSRCTGEQKRNKNEIINYLIEQGARPKSFQGPIKESIERGCSSFLEIYLSYATSEEIAQSSLRTQGNDFISFLEQINKRELLGRELIIIDQVPLTVDMAIRKNSELCQDNNGNCLARDHLMKELHKMKKAVADFSYFKACRIQVELFNTLQLMDEQIEFAKATGVASPETYDAHASEAQNLRGWYHYFQGLFFKNTGEEPNLEYCYL